MNEKKNKVNNSLQLKMLGLVGVCLCVHVPACWQQEFKIIHVRINFPYNRCCEWGMFAVWELEEHYWPCDDAYVLSENMHSGSKIYFQTLFFWVNILCKHEPADTLAMSIIFPGSTFSYILQMVATRLKNTLTSWGFWFQSRAVRIKVPSQRLIKTICWAPNISRLTDSSRDGVRTTSQFHK